MLQFNEKRATQTAARFLQKAGGTMNYMVLIKFLYLADRESLIRWGSPISGDTYFSMRYGPVLSKTHDLITEMSSPEEDSFWLRHIRRVENDVQLFTNPGDEELSEADEALLEEIFQKYDVYRSDPFGFVRYLHTILPEWKQVEKGGRAPIEYHDILVAGKKSVEEIIEIESELRSIGWVQEFLRVG